MDGRCCIIARELLVTAIRERPRIQRVIKGGAKWAGKFKNDPPVNCGTTSCCLLVVNCRPRRNMVSVMMIIDMLAYGCMLDCNTFGRAYLTSLGLLEKS